MKFPSVRSKTPASSAAAVTAVSPELPEGSPATRPKGRPTPKRRDADPRPGPVAAPKTRKEAIARKRQMLKNPPKSAAPAAGLSAAERRQRMLAGDEAFLPKRDAGPLRKLARDYVDSRRMISNLLLILFPLSLVTVLVHSAASILNLLVVAVLIVVLGEWVFTGRRVIALARERGVDTGRDSAFTMATYCGMRAYLPRRFRVPKARLHVGDAI